MVKKVSSQSPFSLFRYLKPYRVQCVVGPLFKLAEAVLELARLTGAEAAVLKERSPTCGSGAVYDGTFSGTLTAGWGVAAGLLREQGIRVLGESRLEELLRQDVR